MIKQKRSNIIFCLLLIISLIAICYFFPYTHDDWGWGCYIGIDRLTNLFQDYNGRWSGNILVLLLTRNRIFRALIESFILIGIIYFIKKIINSNKNTTLLSIILLLLIPIPVLAQGIAWTSGFANYVPPVLIILIYLYFNKNIFNNEEINIKKRWIIIFLLLGFISTMFVEHVTIYITILSLFIPIYIFIKHKKISIPNMFFTIGAIGGTILMFSNGAYHNIVSAQDTYRSIEQGNIISRAFNTYFNELNTYLVQYNTVINIIICTLLLIIVYKYLKKNQDIKKYKKILLYISTFISIGYLSYNLYVNVLNGSNVFIYETYKKIFEGIMVLSYCFSIITIISLTQVKEQRKRMLFEVVSIIILALPLLLVKPIGPRCFFPTYVFFIILTCELFNVSINKNYNLNKIFSFIIVFLLICSLSIYGYIFKIDYERINYINNNKNADILILPELPFINYMQAPNPRSEEFKSRFKEFYNINNETKLKFINYKVWNKKYK